MNDLIDEFNHLLTDKSTFNELKMMKKKRNIRQRGRNSDSDEDKSTAAPVSALSKNDQIPFLETDYHTQIKQIEKEKSTKKREKAEKLKQKSSLLTFADEEEEEGGEVFQIKKSSHSRKQVRKFRERQRQLRTQAEISSSIDTDNHKNGGQQRDSPAPVKERNDVPRIKNEREEEKKKEKQKQAAVVLNGLDAEVAAMAQEDLEEINMKSEFTGFMPGVIPDANLIHAARKRRQLARERGDFIPVDDTQRYQAESSRLVRDDDNDDSGSDEERVVLTVKQRTNRQRVQQALDEGGMSPEAQNEEHGDHSEEMERWEQEQIKKGTGIPQVGVGSSGPSAPDPTSYYPQNQYSYYPAESSAYPSVDQSLVYGSAYSSGLDAGQGPPLQQQQQQQGQGQQPAERSKPPDALKLPSRLPEVTVESVVKRLKQRLESLQEIHRAHQRENESLCDQLQDAAVSSTSLRDTQEDVSTHYTFFQETRGYVRDLVECLQEKVPLINGLETALLTLLQTQAGQLLARHQLDIKDQSADLSGPLGWQAAKAAAAPNLSRSQKKAAREDEEERQRRGAEREARRARRRRARQLAGHAQAHDDGASSDDEVTDSMQAKFNTEKERIMVEQAAVFEDVEEEFCSLPAIFKRFQRWKFREHESYSDAYIGLCLPRLCEPFVRQQMLDWNPLRANCPDIESYPWYDALMFYGFRDEDDFDREDDDIKLIPRLIEKVVLPKLSDLVEKVWDPMSTLQTHRLIDTMHQLAQDYPTVSADNKNTQVLLRAVVLRIRRTLDNDVYMPLFPADMLENKTSGANAFLQRQFWSCLKLLGNLLSWHGLVNKDQLLELAIDGLLNRYLLLSINNSEIDETSIAKCQRIVSTLPVAWFEDLEGDSTLRQLEPLCKYLTHAATHLQQTPSQTSAPEDQVRRNRSLIKLIMKQLVNMRAMDHALRLTDTISIKDIKQLVSS